MKRILFSLLVLLMPLCARAGGLSSQVLDEMNLARTNPRAYASFVATQGDSRDVREAVHFLEKARTMQPLSFSQGLAAGAGMHVLDQGLRGSVGHGGSDRSSPFDRMSRFGAWQGCAGENIYYGNRNARGIVVALIIDSGVWSRGHRKNIFNPSFAVAGVASGRHPKFGAMCVMDFAGGFAEKGSVAQGSPRKPTQPAI